MTPFVYWSIVFFNMFVVGPIIIKILLVKHLIRYDIEDITIYLIVMCLLSLAWHVVYCLIAGSLAIYFIYSRINKFIDDCLSHKI